MQQIEARPATPPSRPALEHSPSEEELRRELDDAIDRRRAADTRAKAANRGFDDAPLSGAGGHKRPFQCH